MIEADFQLMISNKVADLWEKYSKRKVRVVAFPVTPTAVYDLVYKPDSFMSRVFDHQALDNEEIVASAPTRNGPAYLSYLTLDQLFGAVNNSRSEQTDWDLQVKVGAYCARTSYYQKKLLVVDSDGFVKSSDEEIERFAFEADIHQLNLTSRSCNAGSHFVVPKAPFITSLVHLKQGMDVNILEYCTSQECERMFPDADFSKNEVVDNFIRVCRFYEVVDYDIDPDEDDDSLKRFEALDAYDRHCLRELGKNRIIKEEEEWLKKLNSL
jgi:hypothetical protein